LGYNSYYKKSDDETLDAVGIDPEKKDKPDTSVSIGGPLMLWIGLLVFGVLLQLVFVPFGAAYHRTAFNSYFNFFADFVIYVPGIFILPLLISLWIGERVSYLKERIGYKALIHAVYAAVIYIVTIVIIYFVMKLQGSGALVAVNTVTFLEYVVGVPLLILLVITPLFAKLSAARRH